MHAIIKINMDNSAFCDPAWELTRILRELAGGIEKHHIIAPGYEQGLRDFNGNVVGYCQVKEE